MKSSCRMMKLTWKNSSSPTAQHLSLRLMFFAIRYRNISRMLKMPQYTLGRPSLKVGSMLPPMFPATCRMASRSPLTVFSLAMFSRKPVGKLFTLDWVCLLYTSRCV